MRANRSDNDFQFQLTAIFSDNDFQYQLKIFKKFIFLFTFKTLYDIIKL